MEEVVGSIPTSSTNHPSTGLPRGPQFSTERPVFLGLVVHWPPGLCLDRQNCGQIFRYAIATGRAERDPAGDLRGAFPPVTGGHFATITDPAGIGALLRAIDGYEGTFVARCALRLAPLVFVRPGELRAAEWSEFD